MSFQLTSERREQLANWGLLTLRLGIGLGLFWLHGRAKLSSAAAYVFSSQPWSFVKVVASLGFPAPGVFATAAALAESIGSLLLAAGLATRLAGAAVSFTMVVAISLHLRGGQTPELAVLYFLPAFTLALTGPGAYSLDAILRSVRARKTSPAELATPAAIR
jgi:putative oxidoreductase